MKEGLDHQHISNSRGKKTAWFCSLSAFSTYKGLVLNDYTFLKIFVLRQIQHHFSFIKSLYLWVWDTVKKNLYKNAESLNLCLVNLNKLAWASLSWIEWWFFSITNIFNILEVATFYAWPLNVAFIIVFYQFIKTLQFLSENIWNFSQLCF